MMLFCRGGNHFLAVDDNFIHHFQIQYLSVTQPYFSRFAVEEITLSQEITLSLSL